MTLPTRVFQVSSGREIIRFYANPRKESRAARLSCAAWSPDSRLLAVAEEGSGTVRLIEVASGQVVGLIEAMKLFNEIKSDIAGTVTRILAETGTLVKRQQPLLEVDPR